MPAKQAELLAALRRWTVAYSRTLLVHLREDGDVTAELQVKLASDLRHLSRCMLPSAVRFCRIIHLE